MMRRRFLHNFLLWTGAGLLLGACSQNNSDDEESSTAGNCSANGAAMSIGSNDGHTGSTVTSSDVIAGIQKTYNINAGTAGHAHTVTVTASGFSQLLGNSTIIVTTDADGTGHTH